MGEGESQAVVLARLDANVTNLMQQMTEIKGAQRELVSRERMEIEVQTRATDVARMAAENAQFRLDSATDRQALRTRIETLERSDSTRAGQVRLLGFLLTLSIAIAGFLVGHLYLK